MAGTIKVTEYYNQIKMIGKEETNTPFNKLVIKDTVGTFQLIDEIIRDLVHIKNEVKNNRDSQIIGTSASTNTGDDVIQLDQGNTINGLRQATVWASSSLSGRGITTTQGDIPKVPAIYKNESSTDIGYLSEGGLFLALKKVGTDLKTIRYGTKTQIADLHTNLIK